MLLEDKTVVITLKEAQAPNPAIEIPIVPEHIWSEISNPAEYANDKDVVGSGPFLLESYKANQFITLKANPSFWRGTPKIDTIQYVYYTNSDAQVQALRSGDVDFVSGLTPTQYTALKGADGITEHAGIGRRFSSFSFNSGLKTVDGQAFGNGNPALKDVEVRQAIRLGTDTKTLLDTAQTSKIDFTSFAGTLGNSTVPADLPDVDPATDFHQNPDTTWSFDADGLNLAFRMPKAGTFDVLAPSSFSFEATTVAFGVLPVTCNADAAPGGYGHPITVVKNESTTTGSSNTPVKHGAKAVLKAKVSAQNHAPTGKVTFKQGKKKLGTATIKKGKAVLKLKLSKGTHKIKAFYGGDGYTNESTSAVFKVVQK